MASFVIASLLPFVSGITYRKVISGWCEDVAGCATVFDSTTCRAAIGAVENTTITSTNIRSSYNYNDIRGCSYSRPFTIVNPTIDSPIKCGANGYSCYCQCGDTPTQCAPRLASGQQKSCPQGSPGDKCNVTCPVGYFGGEATCLADPISGVGQQWLYATNQTKYPDCILDPFFCPATNPTLDPNQVSGCAASALGEICTRQCVSNYTARDVRCRPNGASSKGYWWDRQGQNESNWEQCKPVPNYVYKALGSTRNPFGSCEDYGDCTTVYNVSECRTVINDGRNFSPLDTSINVRNVSYEPAGCHQTGYAFRMNYFLPNMTVGNYCTSEYNDFNYVDYTACICKCPAITPAPTTPPPTAPTTRRPTDAPTTRAPSTGRPTFAPTFTPTSNPTTVISASTPTTVAPTSSDAWTAPSHVPSSTILPTSSFPTRAGQSLSPTVTLEPTTSAPHTLVPTFAPVANISKPTAVNGEHQLGSVLWVIFGTCFFALS